MQITHCPGLNSGFSFPPYFMMNNLPNKLNVTEFIDLLMTWENDFSLTQICCIGPNVGCDSFFTDIKNLNTAAVIMGFSGHTSEIQQNRLNTDHWLEGHKCGSCSKCHIHQLCCVSSPSSSLKHSKVRCLWGSEGIDCPKHSLSNTHYFVSKRAKHPMKHMNVYMQLLFGSGLVCAESLC